MNYASAEDRGSVTKSEGEKLTMLEMPIYNPEAVSPKWPMTVFYTAGFEILQYDL